MLFLGSVDAANNLRDKKVNFHDIISTERWKMRFFGFFLGLCEANAFSAYRYFAKDGKISHSEFKDSLAFFLLNYCNKVRNDAVEVLEISQRVLRRDTTHELVNMQKPNSTKRIRLACIDCRDSQVSGTRVQTCCSCNPDRALCRACHIEHLKAFWSGKNT